METRRGLVAIIRSFALKRVAGELSQKDLAKLPKDARENLNSLMSEADRTARIYPDSPQAMTDKNNADRIRLAGKANARYDARMAAQNSKSRFPRMRRIFKG